MNILIVDLNFIGDMLMSSPVYRAFKDRSEYCKVDALVYDFCEEAVRANPYANEIITLKDRKLWTAIKMALSMRKRKYDLVLQLNTSLRTNFLMFLMGVKRRLGYDYKHRGFLNTIRVPIAQRTCRKGNRVDECLALLEKAYGWKIEHREMIFEI